MPESYRHICNIVAATKRASEEINSKTDCMSNDLAIHCQQFNSYSAQQQLTNSGLQTDISTLQNTINNISSWPKLLGTYPITPLAAYLQLNIPVSWKRLRIEFFNLSSTLTGFLQGMFYDNASSVSSSFSLSTSQAAANLVSGYLQLNRINNLIMGTGYTGMCDASQNPVAFSNTSIPVKASPAPNYLRLYFSAGNIDAGSAKVYGEYDGA